MDFATALNELTATVETVIGIAKERNESKLTEASGPLMAQLMSVRVSVLELKEEALTLKAKIREAKANVIEAEAKLRERDSYVLHKLANGDFVLRFQHKEDSVEPPHYVCQHCTAKGVKVVLQPTHEPFGFEHERMHCPECRTTY
jgi:Zn finger protein HypA/HybF involved in hydrogenase expression